MRRYGIELEFTSNLGRDAIAQMIQETGVECRAQNYNHNTRPYWKIITDSSAGYEIVSPILQGEDGIEQIKKVCAVLKEVAKVDRNCGYHIHIDANGLSLGQIKSVVKSYKQYEDVFDVILPKSRRENNNGYCMTLQRIRDRDIDSATTINELYQIAFRSNRYWKLNIASLLRHGTIEIRQHSGTVEADKVVNWVYLIQNFIQRSIDDAIACESDSLRDRFNALIPETVGALEGAMTAENIAIEAIATSSMKMKDIKSEVYNLMGVNSTKEVKRQAIALGIEVSDFRKKSTWIAILSLLRARPSTPEPRAIALREFYHACTRRFRTDQLLAA